MFINIGFGNVVSSEKIVAIVSPAAAPVKRMIQEARESGLLVDASCGRHTRSVITCDSRHVILSALMPETIVHRLNTSDTSDTEKESELTDKEY